MHGRASILFPLLTAAGVMAAPAEAQEEASISDKEEIRSEIRRLRTETDARIAELRAETDARIARLEVTAGIAAAPAPSPTPSPRATGQAVAAAPVPTPDAFQRNIRISGDARVRYEQNFGDSRRDRGRAAVRARLAVDYSASKNLEFGARIATGDPDDPNSTDVTLSGFDDDLDVSLDRLFVHANFGGLDLYGGKFANPFRSTDMVWDGDVNPQGVAGIYTHPVGRAASLRASTLYFLINEDSGARDSNMIGGQLAIDLSPASQWKLKLAAAYYDYNLRSLVGADSGDFRSNLVAGGRYVSGFRLVDAIGSVTYTGLGERFPVELSGNYVTNRAAVVAGDSGFLASLAVGRATEPEDWRFHYGYSEVGVDAVLAAFSHDNTDLPTNYLQHTLALDYVPLDDILLNASFYRYRVKDPAYPAAIPAGDWANRLRVSIQYSF
jgi:hypothetical protein